ncbi:predicted protein [Plenodomus lingam JN3]|uniref:Predicted protein n=1 Tax=Leptosphaeria maculans (strain JN3 / isolate v23.1.3 / race Av1-4-5-6-7-8) TaxID=985895 RepID=E5ACE5_LEPMJ|nr:predicted protein [Plenodomus lingam JN3]CBY02147.1 predicted protein [Plenodomus lingam JN3]
MSSFSKSAFRDGMPEGVHVDLCSLHAPSAFTQGAQSNEMRVLFPLPNMHVSPNQEMRMSCIRSPLKHVTAVNCQSREVARSTSSHCLECDQAKHTKSEPPLAVRPRMEE